MSVLPSDPARRPLAGPTGAERRGPRLRRLVPAAAVLATLAAGLGAAPADAATPRAFTCSGVISRAYTLQTVTGTLTGTRPSATTVLDSGGTPVLTTSSPTRANGWWGGYWRSTYGLTQWKLGTDAAGTVYHLMLPGTRPGGAFDALLVSEFGGGAQGNWQNWMTCTAG